MAAAEKTETVRVNIKKLYAAIMDVGTYPSFVTGMKEARVLEDQGETKKVHFDLEMMKRLQYSVNLRSQFDEAKQEARVDWSLDRSEFFKVNNGSWTLKAKSSEETTVTYKLEVEFTFPVPGFILKGLIANGLPSAIREFSEQARKLA